MRAAREESWGEILNLGSGLRTSWKTPLLRRSEAGGENTACVAHA